MGDVDVELLTGLGQVLGSFVATGLYVRSANRHLDPRATAIRRRLELELN